MDLWKTCSKLLPYLRTSGVLRTSGPSWLPGRPDTSGRPTLPQQKHFYGCPEPSGRPTLSHQKHSYGCPAQLGRPYPVHWIVGHTFHSGRSSDDCRTSGPICASGRPTFSGRPAHPVPQTVTFTHHLYIYLSLPRDKVDHSLWASQEHSSHSLSFIHTKS